MTPLTQAHNWKQNSKVGESLCASTPEPDHVLRGEEPVEHGLGLLGGLGADAAGAGASALAEEFKANRIAFKAKRKIVNNRRGRSSLGVEFAKKSGQSSHELTGVFLSHRAAALVIIGPSPHVKDSTFALAHSKVSKEHMRAMFGGVGYLSPHSRFLPVLGLFLAFPPAEIVLSQGNPDKLRKRNDAESVNNKTLADPNPDIAGRAA